MGTYYPGSKMKLKLIESVGKYHTIHASAEEKSSCIDVIQCLVQKYSQSN